MEKWFVGWMNGFSVLEVIAEYDHFSEATDRKNLEQSDSPQNFFIVISYLPQTIEKAMKSEYETGVPLTLKDRERIWIELLNKS